MSESRSPATEQQLGALMDRITDGLLALDERGRFVYLNRPAEQILDRSREELVGRVLADVLPHLIGASVLRAYQEAMRSQQMVRFEESPEGSGRHFDVRLYPSEDGVTACLRDITEQKWLEREREVLLAAERDARLEAERQAKLRKQVLSMVSHDLRNPLNAIVLNLELLRDEFGEQSVGEVDVDRVGRALQIAQRMGGFMEGLLNMSRLEAGYGIGLAPDRQLVGPLLDQAHAMFAARAAAKGVRLVIEAPARSLGVWADEDRLLQVLWNLIDNAIKFTPPGARVVVGATAADAGVRFSVTDRGPGVPQAHRDRLFDVFWQEKQAARLGSGVGLPICRAIVEAHGGKIWLETEEGQGTTFFFTVPLASAAAPDEPDRPR